MNLFIFSWNVNGYSAKIHEWLMKYVENNSPDIVFLSETKRGADKMPLEEFSNYNAIVNSHEPSRYHGVAMLIKKSISYDEYEVALPIDCRRDNCSDDASKGRIIIIKLSNNINIIGTYVPNSGTNKQANYSYRVDDWDPAFSDLIKELGPKTIWIGDINVARDSIDVSNPRKFSRFAGFTQMERQNFEKLLAKGLIDTWRLKNGNKIMYSWTGSLGNPLKYGMRLDNILVTEDIKDNVKISSYVDINLSDHVPITCNFEF